jgi:peroxiredoxin Q/BCP
LHEYLDGLNMAVFGVSRDGVRSHANSPTKQGFPFDLISDVDKAPH